MTEAEWLAATFSTPMFEVLRKHQFGSARKRLLLGFACCDLVRPFMSEDGRQAVEVAGLFSRGEATEADRWEAFERAGDAMEAVADLNRQRADWCAYRVVQLAGEPEFPTRWDHDTAAQSAQSAPEAFAWAGSKWDAAILAAHRRVIAEWVRDIFGNPFRPIALAPIHRPPTVVSLAQAAYDEQQLPSGELEPHRLTVLADALEEMGAPDELMEHLRSPGLHVRGCFAVDLCLGLT